MMTRDDAMALAEAALADTNDAAGYARDVCLLSGAARRPFVPALAEETERKLAAASLEHLIGRLHEGNDTPVDYMMVVAAAERLTAAHNAVADAVWPGFEYPAT